MKIEEVIKQLESILAHVCSMAASPDADDIWKEDIAALEFALTALRSMPEAREYHFRDATKMVPLTLGQLREMNGKPVWIVEYPDWVHWELSEDAEDYLCDRDTDLYGLIHPDPDGKAGLHKLGWLAYAYPPAHIDRSEWEKCELCSLTDGKPASRLILAETCNGEAKYCPSCGRPLTEEALAELERRLRG